MRDKQEITVELTERQIEFLDRMVEKHGLPDRGKAVRCLVNFASDESGEEDRIFGEIRCLDC